MNELYSLKISVDGLNETIQRVDKFNRQLENLGKNHKGLTTFQASLASAVRDMTNAANQISSQFATVSLTSSKMYKEFSKQTRDMGRAAEALNRSTKQNFEKVFKGLNFSDFTSGMKDAITMVEGFNRQLAGLNDSQKGFTNFHSNMANAARDMTKAAQQISNQFASINSSNSKMFKEFSRQSKEMAKAAETLNRSTRQNFEKVLKGFDFSEFSNGMKSAIKVMEGFNAQLTGLGESQKGFNSFHANITAAVRDMTHAANQMTMQFSRIHEANSRMYAEIGIQAKAYEKAAEVVRRGTTQKVQDVLKNVNFSEYTEGMKALQSRAELSNQQLEKLAKTAKALSRLRLDLNLDDEDVSTAIKRLKGSNFLDYLKDGVNDDLINIRAQQAILNSKKAELELNKKIEKSEKEIAQAANKSAAYESTIRKLERNLQLNKMDLDALDAKRIKLREIEAEYNRINRLTGVNRDKAFSQFTSTYGSGAATEEASQVRNRLITSLSAKYEENLAKANQQLNKAKQMSNDLHGIWRGIAASTGNLWLSWGNFTTMAAGLALGSSVFQSLTVNREFGWQIEQAGVAAEVAGSQLEALKQEILDINRAGSVQGPTQMASALRLLAQAGMTAQEAMANLPTVLDFSLVGEISDEQSAHFLAGLKSAFDLKTVDDLREGADITAKAAALSQTSIEKMSEALKQSSSEAARFGLSVSDTSAALSILAKFNIEGSAAGTSLRNFLSDLGGRTRKSKEALDELGLTLYNSEGMVKPFVQIVGEVQQKLSGLTDKQKQDWLKKIFNERGIKTANILLSEAGKEFADLHNELTRAGENMGYTSTQAERLGETAEGAFRKMKNSWEGLFASTGSKAEGGFKSLMTEMQNLANDESIRQGVLSLTNGFLTAAKTAVGLVNALSPLAPLLAGIGAAATVGVGLTWIGNLGLMAKAASLATTAVGSLSTTMGMMAVSMSMSSSTAVGALSALRVAAASLMTSLGPVGIAALATGGIVSYLMMAEEKTISFRDELTKLDETLGSVDLDKYTKFNESGFGFELDKRLGIGYKSADITQALVSPQSISDYKTNLDKIVDATDSMLEEVNKNTESSSTYQAEQQMMLTERKASLLKEQLEKFDKTTAHMDELDAESKRVRTELEEVLLRTSTSVMEQRTNLALQHMRDMQAEAERTKSIFEKLSRFFSGDAYSAETRLERVQKAVKSGQSLSSEDQKFLREYNRGTPLNEAHALTRSKLAQDPEGFNRALKYATSTTGAQDWVNEVKTNPQKAATYMKDLLDGINEKLAGLKADIPSNNYEQDIISKKIKTLEQQKSIAASQYEYAMNYNSKIEANKIRTRVNPNVKSRLGDVDVEPTAVKSAKPAPTYSSMSYSNRENDYTNKLVERQKQIIESLDYQIEQSRKERGYADESLILKRQTAENDLAKLKVAQAQAQLARDTLKDEAAIKKAKAAMNNPKMSAEDRARAAEDYRQMTGTAAYNLTLKFDKVQYSFGKKNLGSGAIDCSGFVAELYSETAKEVNRQLGTQKLNPNALKGKGASEQIRAFAGNTVMQGRLRSLDASQFRHGMAIGTDNGNYNWDKGRYKGIDHIVYVVSDKEGNLFASQSSSGKGVNMMPLQKYLKTANNGQATVVDTLGGLNSGISGGSLAQSNAMQSQINAQTAAMEAQQLVAKHTAELEALRVERLKVENQTTKDTLTAEENRLEIQNILGQVSTSTYERRKLELEIERQKLEIAERYEEIKSKDGVYAADTYKSQAETELKQKEAEFNARTLERTDWKTGLKRAYRDLVDETVNYGQMTADAFDSVTGTMISSMQNLAVTGKLNFRDMTTSILQDLAKITMRMAMLNLIKSAGAALGIGAAAGAAGAAGGAAGGITLAGVFSTAAKGRVFDQSGQVKAYAKGGVVNSPTNFLFSGGRGLMGENGAEGILPLARMSNGDLGVQMQGAGGSNVVLNAPVTVSVTVNSDGSADSQVDAPQAQQLGQAIRATVLQVLTKETMPGGMVYRAVKGAI